MTNDLFSMGLPRTATAAAKLLEDLQQLEQTLHCALRTVAQAIEALEQPKTASMARAPMPPLRRAPPGIALVSWTPRSAAGARFSDLQ